MKNTVGGNYELFLDGVKMPTVNGAKVKAGHQTKETKLGPRGEVHGHVDKPNSNMISITFANKVNMGRYADRDDMTVRLREPNGVVHVLSDAWLVEDPEIDLDEGQMEVQFTGMTYQRLGDPTT